MKDVQKGLFVEDSKSPWILAEFPFGLSNKKWYEIHDSLTTIIKGGWGGGEGRVLKCESDWLAWLRGVRFMTYTKIYAFPNCDF